MTTTSTRSLLVVGLPSHRGEDEPAGGGPMSVVDEVDRHLPGPGLVLVHDDRPEGGDPGERARAAAVAGAVLGRDEIVIRSVPGPLSRFVLLARVLEASQAPTGVLAAGVDRVLSAVRTSALLANVARLEAPTPSLAQHARGLLPGGCFLVDGATVQTVKHRLPRGMGRGAEAVLVTGQAPVGDWPDRLWSALGPAGEQPATVVLAGSSCWGTNRWAEISVVHLAADEMAARLDRTPTSCCSWCGRPIAADAPCPFCGAQPGAAHHPAVDQPEDNS